MGPTIYDQTDYLKRIEREHEKKRIKKTELIKKKSNADHRKEML